MGRLLNLTHPPGRVTVSYPLSCCNWHRRYVMVHQLRICLACRSKSKKCDSNVRVI